MYYARINQTLIIFLILLITVICRNKSNIDFISYTVDHPSYCLWHLKAHWIINMNFGKGNSQILPDTALLQAVTLFSGTQTRCRRVYSIRTHSNKTFYILGQIFLLNFLGHRSFPGGVLKNICAQVGREPPTLGLPTRYSTNVPPLLP